MENETLAMELLHELKRSAKRWFIIAIIELVILVGVILSFMWYISLPVEEQYSIDQEASDRSFNLIGGDYNGGETESDLP